MKRRPISLLVAFGVALGLAGAAFGVVVPGGGKKKSDCYAGFEVEGEEGGAKLVGTTQVLEKVAKGGSCNFDVRLCVNEPVTGCAVGPPNVTGFAVNTGGLALPSLGSTHACGETKTFTVPLKGKNQNKPGKMKIRAVASSDGKPKSDPDTLLLKCIFGTPPTFCGAVTPPTAIPCTSVPVSSATCPPNPAGGPNEADVTVANSGTDLDNGWTGTSHNFPVVGGS